MQPGCAKTARARLGEIVRLLRAEIDRARMARLTADFWVRAYLARLRLADIPAFVVSRGDDTAGAVLVKLNTLDGNAVLYQRSVDLMTGARTWVALAEGSEAEIDASVAKQRGFDPDLWVIEVEDRGGRHLLDEDGLA